MTDIFPAVFLSEMKDKLLAEEKRLEAELKAISHRHEGDVQTDFPDYGRSDEDNATEMADYQALAGTTVVIEQRLKSVQAALTRLEKGTYGMTADGQKIPEKRLRANPAATTLV